MPRYQDDSLQFEVPRDWEDRTIVAYAAPPAPGRQSSSNLVLTRDSLRDTETLESYVDRHVEQLGERLDGFEVASREPREIGGRPAVCLHVRSGGAADRLYQLLTMVELPGRTVASLTLTAPDRDALQLRPLFERILTTVEVRRPSEGSEEDA